MVAGNTITGRGSNGVKLTEADNNTFDADTLSGIGGSLYFAGATGNRLHACILAAGQKISSVAAAGGPGSTVVEDPPGPIGVSVDATSNTDITSTDGKLFTVSGRSLATQTSAGGSLLRLTSAVLGTTGSVKVTPAPVTVSPASGTTLSSVSGSGSTAAIKVQESAVSVATITSSTFTPARSYHVLRNGIDLGLTVTADATGTISFSDTPATTDFYEYRFVQA